MLILLQEYYGLYLGNELYQSLRKAVFQKRNDYNTQDGFNTGSTGGTLGYLG